MLIRGVGTICPPQTPRNSRPSASLTNRFVQEFMYEWGMPEADYFGGSGGRSPPVKIKFELFVGCPRSAWYRGIRCRQFHSLWKDPNLILGTKLKLLSSGSDLSGRTAMSVCNVNKIWNMCNYSFKTAFQQLLGGSTPGLFPSVMQPMQLNLQFSCTNYLFTPVTSDPGWWHYLFTPVISDPGWCTNYLFTPVTSDSDFV
jgi:hypothetical protein